MCSQPNLGMTPAELLAKPDRFIVAKNLLRNCMDKLARNLDDYELPGKHVKFKNVIRG